VNFLINPLFASARALCRGAAAGIMTSKINSIFLTNLDICGLLVDLPKELIKALKAKASEGGEGRERAPSWI
jgi:hypothetical protein